MIADTEILIYIYIYMAHLKWLYDVFLVALQKEGIHVWIFFHPLPADGEKAPSHSRTEVTGNLTI